MKLPNWFKVLWWVLLLGGLTYFLYRRYPDLVVGHSSYADVFVFLIWVALFLLPLFQEISFFGLTFKKEIEALKADVKGEIAELRSDIRNTVDIRTQFNPSFTFAPLPPSDSQLPLIEERVRNILDEFVRAHNLRMPAVPSDDLKVEDDVSFLFGVRYNIEKELRRIWKERYGEEDRRRPLSIHQVSRMLAEEQLIDPALISVIREVYSVTSPAIHGEEVSKAQMAFVKDVAPNLIAALRSV
ncbi:MAG TPA: hypothetical protein VGA95_03530 [Thermodesulfobacteriota bacterium]